MQKPPARQETPVRALDPVLEALHSGIAAVGASLARAWPWPSTATHSPVDAHETAVRCSPSIGVWLHVGAEEPGSALASAWPPLSTATQVPLAEHDTATSSSESSLCSDHVPVGVVVESTSPLLSTATHSPAEAHETPRRWTGWLLANVQPPPPGFVVVNTWPSSSTATQNAALGQEMPVRASVAGNEDGDSAPITHALPPLSTATHRPPGAQETAFSDLPESLNAGLQLGLGLVGSEVNAVPS
jgi:hypothetical protein